MFFLLNGNLLKMNMFIKVFILCVLDWSGSGELDWNNDKDIKFKSFNYWFNLVNFSYNLVFIFYRSLLFIFFN